jgi:cytochrome c peroxidase
MRGVRRIVWLATLFACGKDAGAPSPEPGKAHELTAVERGALATLSPLPAVPPDPSNAFADDPRAAALGQMLFFDKALSGPLVIDNALGRAGERGKVSCATCHAGPALDDQHSKPNHVSIGTEIGTRNSPPVLNSAFYTWSNWGGRFDSQWSLVLGASENPEVMNANRVAAAHMIAAKYRAEYDAIFPAKLDPALGDRKRFPTDAKPKKAGAPDGAWEAMAPADRALVDRIFANAGKAIAAYMRKLVARNAPFDRYAAGETAALSDAAKRGFRLFLAHCESCHSGPHFQDNRFHALGVAQFGEHVPAADLGRFTDVVPLLASPFNTSGAFSDGAGKLGTLAQDAAQRGQFRTPTLRNVAVTAPYMHAGQFATLAAVVAFYNAGGGRVDGGVIKAPEMKRLELSAEQQADLVEFMETLTDTTIAPALLADTSR